MEEKILDRHEVSNPEKLPFSAIYWTIEPIKEASGILRQSEKYHAKLTSRAKLFKMISRRQ